MKGSRNMCTRCGTLITKTSFIDPYLCRWCEVDTDFSDIYGNLDPKIV